MHSQPLKSNDIIFEKVQPISLYLLHKDFCDVNQYTDVYEHISVSV